MNLMVHFIHIGYPKTGSTWLQDCFFSQIPEICVLGTNHGAPDVRAEFVKEVQALIFCNELAFDKRRFRNRIAELQSRQVEYLGQQGRDPKVFGISHEVLSGQFLTGRKAAFIARTLRDCYPDARIILFIRNQRSMIESAYKLYIRAGGTVGFKEFLMAPATYMVSDGLTHSDAPFNTSVVEYFKYSRLVRLYVELFGRRNVCVDCLERLKGCKPEVTTVLFSFLGVEPIAWGEDKQVNVQLTPVSLSILRQLNRLFKTYYNPRGLIAWTRGYARLWSLFRDKFVENDNSETNPYLASFLAQNGIQRRITEFLQSYLDEVFFRVSREGIKRDYFRKLPSQYQEWLFGEYRTDNATLQKMVNFDIRALGYPV